MTMKVTGGGIEGASVAAGNNGHAEGLNCKALADNAHAEGSSTTASAQGAHAEGSSSTASGISSHAEGSSTTASGTAAHSEGAATTASGTNAHAEGVATTAAGNYSHAQGRYTTTNKIGQDAQSALTIATLLATQAQYSTYVAGALLAATNGASAELTFFGDGTVTTSGAGTSVLVIPLKSVVLVQFDIVARPNANASATAMGASWSGSVLCGRGNATGTAMAFSTGDQVTVSTQQTVARTYSFNDAQSNSLSLAYSLVNTDTTNNYFRLMATNTTATPLAWTLAGTLRCVELVTNV